MTFGAVAIGRNEGLRLRRCIGSLSSADAIVYVNSGSTDDSVLWARSVGVEVVELSPAMPFTAARARNAGFKRLLELRPSLSFIQFIDGDCELNAGWPTIATSHLSANSSVGAVFGRRRERSPERSIYNWICDREWEGPAGNAQACGGDAMMRAAAFEAAGGFNPTLIAGEEPELCFRMRALGWKIWRLDYEMTLHDASITQFKQWWKRMMRSGYAVAEGAYLHGASTEHYRVWEILARRMVGAMCTGILRISNTDVP